MAKNKGKLLLTVMISVVLIGAISCGNGNSKNKNSVNTKNVQKAEKQNKNTQQQTEEKRSEEEFVGLGIDKEFTTDGKLHEEKFLNKRFMYPDSGGSSFKIEKNKDGYFITGYYIDESSTSEQVTERIKKSKLKLYKDVYLIDEEGVHAYGYDTALKNVVILNAKNNFRIIYEAEKME